MTGKRDAYASLFGFFGLFFGAFYDTQILLCVVEGRLGGAYAGLGVGLLGFRPLVVFAAVAAFFGLRPWTLSPI